jgi:hypothetical protein
MIKLIKRILNWFFAKPSAPSGRGGSGVGVGIEERPKEDHKK